VSTFDITGPLPTGTTLLEASAGTGKTWTIGALVTRFVAEGEALLEQMLVVTFGRAASQELRERVRAQLVEAEAALADPGAVADPDELLQLLLDADEAVLDLRHARVREALVSFDAATIATTHQFCSMVLDSLGVAGDSDSRTTLVEDLSDLTDEVVDDLFLRAFAFRDDRRCSAGPKRVRSRGRSSPTRRRGSSRRPPTPRPRPVAGSPSHAPSAPSSTAASGSAASSATTTCSSSSPGRSTATTRPREPGCAAGGGSCSSTSSRTPTRSSGRCSTARSPATPRWC
jgi:exodeoxyribonuclease V beta subunit